MTHTKKKVEIFHDYNCFAVMGANTIHACDCSQSAFYKEAFPDVINRKTKNV